MYCLMEWTAKRAAPDAFLRDGLAEPKIFVIGTEDALAESQSRRHYCALPGAATDPDDGQVWRPG